MQDTSQIANYDTIFATGKYSVETKLNINGVDYGENKLFSIQTTPTLFRDVPSVGNCTSAEIYVVMEAPNVSIPKMAMMKPFIRLVGETLTSDWLQKGVFFIDTRERTDYGNTPSVLSIHGYDSMLKAEALYPEDDPGNYPMVDTDVVDLIAETMGIDVDDRTYDIMTEEYEINLPATYSMREVLSNIASMYAGNFCITPLGKLRLVGLTDIGEEIRFLSDQRGAAITFGSDGTFTDTKTGASLKIWAEEEEVDNVTVAITPVQDGTGTASDTNIRLIHGWDSANIVVSPTPNDSDGTTYTVSFESAGTVYNGTLNVTTGELVVNKGLVSYTGSESGWKIVTGSSQRYYIAKPSGARTTSSTSGYLSSCFSTFVIGNTGVWGRLNVGGTDFKFLDSGKHFANLAAFKTWVQGLYSANTPLQIVYPLASSVTYQLTPTEVETVLGWNYIHANTGNTTVTWTVDTAETIILV